MRLVSIFSSHSQIVFPKILTDPFKENSLFFFFVAFFLLLFYASIVALAVARGIIVFFHDYVFGLSVHPILVTVISGRPWGSLVRYWIALEKKLWNCVDCMYLLNACQYSVKFHSAKKNYFNNYLQILPDIYSMSLDRYWCKLQLE